MYNFFFFAFFKKKRGIKTVMTEIVLTCYNSETSGIFKLVF